jgi:predicted Zn-dependent protease
LKNIVRTYLFKEKAGFQHLLGASLFVLVLAASGTGCTLKASPVPAGVVPDCQAPTASERAFGQMCFLELDEDYDVDNSHPRYGQLLEALSHLSNVLEPADAPWHLYLFDDSKIVDVRAVNGNFVFVWSGFLDVVENEDEIAAILALEMAHVLANHTRPVEFTVPTRVFFSTAEVATAVGLLFLSQGTVAIGGQGWMQYLYTEAADLDPLDREYNEEEERAALAIACLLLDRSKYSSRAMLTFWRRVQESSVFEEKDMRLDRSVPLEKRIALLEEILLGLPVTKKMAKKGREDVPWDETFSRPEDITP